jgi:hypothetical protein
MYLPKQTENVSTKTNRTCIYQNKQNMYLPKQTEHVSTKTNRTCIYQNKQNMYLPKHLKNGGVLVDKGVMYIRVTLY